MVRETILNSDDDDEQLDDASGDGSGSEASKSGEPNTEHDTLLRPKRISEMVGQKDVTEVLSIAIDSAKKRGEQLGHILFDGPPGLGKTTFATCIPREMGVRMRLASGPAMKAPKDLLPYVTNLEEGSVLFIDEIHRLPKAVEEYLYTAMEDFRIDVVLGDGVNARTLNLQLRPFTLIGATTRAGMLSGPLRDRFQIREHLGFYQLDELVEILRRNSVKLKIPLDDDAASEIAQRSRGTPRVANNRLLWVRDYATSRADGVITEPIAHKALKMIGIDDLGLDRQDRRYLETVARAFSGGPAGLGAIAYTMSVSADTLEDEVEPFLLRMELIVRTSRGRCLTAKAYRHLKISV
jgi:Holliday junction DNA helicase RuvB